MFLTGPSQAASSASITYLFDLMARHAAHIVAEATKSCTGDPSRLVFEPTKEAEDTWVGEIVSRAGFVAPLSVCLPSYINNEGAMLKGPEATKGMRAMAYPLGINAFAKGLDVWRRKGGLEGLAITAARS